MCVICDGKTMDDVIQHVADKIAEFGWTAIAVAGDGYAFVYSIGLTERHHPELLIRGALPLQAMQDIIATLSESVMAGQVFQDDQVLEDILGPGYSLKFRGPVDVHDAEVFVAQDVYGHQPGAVQVLQVLWPDNDGRFPDDAAFDAAWGATQPLASRVVA